MRLLHWRLVVGLVCLAPVAAQAQAPEKAITPAAALALVKVAVEAGDLKTLAQHTAGDMGVTLRKLAEPYAKAKLANERLERLLKEKSEIGFRNPFAGSLNPLADMQYDIVEVGKEAATLPARIRFGIRGKAQEEAILVRKEGDVWRVDLPGELVKQLQNLAGPERIARHARGLDKLADVLDTLTREIQEGKLRTKDAVTLRLAMLVEETKLAELLR
jgi:hypothetical protein